MKMFKERFDVFIDAVFAIILTIMVLEVPVEVVNGTIEYVKLAQNIGIYVVSFCFVANCWYKHALIFNEVEEVSHSLIILDFILILALSLIPAFTKLMISDITRVTVMLCGSAYLIVTLLEIAVARGVLPTKYSDQQQIHKAYSYVFGKTNMLSTILLVIFIALAYFFPQVSQVLFIIIPVQSFISNATKQQNFEDITQLDSSGVKSFMNLTDEDKRKFLGMLRKYSHEAHKVGHDKEARTQAWQAFSNEIEHTFGINKEQISQWFRDAASQREDMRGRSHTTDNAARLAGRSGARTWSQQIWEDGERNRHHSSEFGLKSSKDEEKLS